MHGRLLIWGFMVLAMILGESETMESENPKESPNPRSPTGNGSYTSKVPRVGMGSGSSSRKAEKNIDEVADARARTIYNSLNDAFGSVESPMKTYFHMHYMMNEEDKLEKFANRSLGYIKKRAKDSLEITQEQHPEFKLKMENIYGLEKKYGRILVLRLDFGRICLTGGVLLSFYFVGYMIALLYINRKVLKTRQFGINSHYLHDGRFYRLVICHLKDDDVLRLKEHIERDLENCVLDGAEPRRPLFRESYFEDVHYKHSSISRMELRMNVVSLEDSSSIDLTRFEMLECVDPSNADPKETEKMECC